MVYLDFALRGLGIFGSGAFFGMALSMSTITMPMILRHKGIPARQKVELWSDLYSLATQRWVPFGMLASALYAAAAYTTRLDKRPLVAAALSMFSIMPLTLTVVFPYVNKLKSYLSGTFPSDTEAIHTLEGWGRRHWVRTVGSGLATVIGLYDLVTLLSP